MKEKQSLLWEKELPEWLLILDRLDEVDISEADSNFINDIDEDYQSLRIIDEAKKFVYYWSGKRKLKTKRKGTWKLGWRNWLDRAKRQNIKHERIKSRTTENSEPGDYFRSKEYLQEVRRKQQERKTKKESKLD